MKRLGWARGATFSTLTMLFVTMLLLLLVPLASGTNFFSSIQLYFKTFEFNASFYALARWGTTTFIGGEAASTVGVWLGGFTLIAILGIAIFHNANTLRSSAEAMLFSLAVYFFLATTIHPWYLTTLVALSAISRSRFALVWSGMVTLSYATYQSIPYQEQAILTFIEYTVVFGTFSVEWRGVVRIEK